MKGALFTSKKKEDVTLIAVTKKEADFKPNDSTEKPKKKLKLNRKFEKKSVDGATPQTSSFREAAPSLTLQQQKKLSKLKSRAEKAEERYFKAEENLPTRQKLRLIRKVNGEKNKVQLHVEEEITAPKESLEVLEKPKALLKQGVSSVEKSAGSAVLGGGSQEQSLEETTTRKVIGKGVDATGRGVKSVASLPRKVEEHRFDKYENAKEKANKKLYDVVGGTHLQPPHCGSAKTSYTKFRIESQNRFDSPSLLDKKTTAKSASNPLSKALQKRRFAKDYRKTLLEQSKKAGKSFSQKIVGIANGVTKHIKKIGLIAAAVFLCFTVIGSCMQGAGTVATGTLKGIFATSYMADDAEIADSDWYFSQLEADFQSQIDMAETTYVATMNSTIFWVVWKPTLPYFLAPWHTTPLNLSVISW